MQAVAHLGGYLDPGDQPLIEQLSCRCSIDHQQVGAQAPAIAATQLFLKLLVLEDDEIEIEMDPRMQAFIGFEEGIPGGVKSVFAGFGRIGWIDINDQGLALQSRGRAAGLQAQGQGQAEGPFGPGGLVAAPGRRGPLALGRPLGRAFKHAAPRHCGLRVAGAVAGR